jgi:DNA-binding MarR family transcriptional regulator
MDDTQDEKDSKAGEMAANRTKTNTFPLLTTIYEVARVAEATLNVVLAPISLSTAQWSILHVIDEHPGIAGATIARQGRVSPAAVTTMLQRLEATGLIERHAQPHGRVMETYLTPSGRERLQAGDAIVKEVEQQLCAIPDECDLVQILTAMKQFITTLNALEKSDAEERGGE